MGPPQGQGPRGPARRKPPLPAPGAQREWEPEPLPSAGRSGQKGQGERPGWPDPEPGPFSLGQDQRPPAWSSAAAGARAPRSGAGWGAGAPPELPPPRVSGVAPPSLPLGRGVSGPPRAHSATRRSAWEGCRVEEPVSLKEPAPVALSWQGVLPGPAAPPAGAEGRCGRASSLPWGGLPGSSSLGLRPEVVQGLSPHVIVW